jgi:hypothetical protein
MATPQGRPPDSANWFHPTDELVRRFPAPSEDLTRRTDRIFRRPRHPVTLAPRVDLRGLKCRASRTTPRARQRRCAPSRRRRTTMSRDDGPSARSNEPAPGRRTVWAYAVEARERCGLA